MTHPLTGRAVLFWLIGFFALVMVVDAAFIAFSIKTYRGEDEQKPYLQGVEFNQTLTRRAAQGRLGWRATIAAERLASGAVRVAVALKGPDGAPRTGQRLSGELRHPMDENWDRPLLLKETGAGLYQAEIGNVHAGTWDVLVRSASTPFEASRRLWLP